MKPYTRPIAIDLCRWWSAFADVCTTVKDVLEQPDRHPPRGVSNAWERVRQHYAYLLAAHSMMTPEQQEVLEEPLEMLRAHLEKLSH